LGWAVATRIVMKNNKICNAKNDRPGETISAWWEGKNEKGLGRLKILQMET
jgi:hypothetical protein